MFYDTDRGGMHAEPGQFQFVYGFESWDPDWLLLFSVMAVIGFPRVRTISILQQVQYQPENYYLFVCFI